MANKNEAKVIFSAETKQFNDAIKASAQETAQLNSNLKENAAQMANSGKSAELLQQKHELLTQKYEAARQKVEALNGKLEAAKTIYGENSDEVKRLERQLTDARTAMINADTAAKNCADEISKLGDSTTDTRNSLEKLEDKISSQEDELKKLKKEYANTVIEQGDTSDAAKELAQKIKELSGDLSENKTKLKDAADAADDLDSSFRDAGNGADEASGGGFTVLKGALADLASNAIQSVIGKLGEFTSYLTGLPEATAEIRQSMGSLTTAYDNVGLSVESATDTWKDLYAVMGDDIGAVEAANNIARIADSQEELDKWTRIATGSYAVYQDALPIASLTEAAGETIKVGQVTGAMADALNWSSEAAVMFADYMSDDVTNAEDAFNEALKECTSEEERQKLVTDTLTALYGDAADTYRDTASAQIEAREATAENILAENELAQSIEPVTTAWDAMKNSILVGLTPAIEKFASVVTPIITWLGEHPAVLAGIATVIGIVTVALAALTVATTIQTIANSALLATMAPLILPILAITAGVAALIAIVVLCVKYWDEIKAAAAAAWDWIVEKWNAAAEWFNTNVVQPIAEFFTGLWESITSGVSAAWEWITGILSAVGSWIYDNVIQPIINIFSPIVQWFIDQFTQIFEFYKSIIMVIIGLAEGCWEIIKAVWSVVSEWFNTNIIQPVKNFFVNLWNTVSGAASTAWNAIKGVWNVVSGWFNSTIIQPVSNFFSNMWNKLKQGASNAWSGIKSVFSSVASFFGDIFGKAWEKVKNIFSTGGKIFSGITEGITAAFKKVVNAIISGINRVVAIPFNAINSVLDKIRNITILGIQPFAGKIGSISVPEIPLLAKGGIVSTPTLNIAGEAGTEAIAPIDKLQGYIEAAVDRANNSARIERLADAIERLADRAIELNIDGTRFATATAGATDTVSGTRLTLKNRGLAL